MDRHVLIKNYKDLIYYNVLLLTLQGHDSKFIILMTTALHNKMIITITWTQNTEIGLSIHVYPTYNL